MLGGSSSDKPATEKVTAFIRSMPWPYKERFDSQAISEHAAIVERRLGQVAHVELWRPLPGGAAVVCAVADDRPGLLSLISASLVAHGLDITSAHCYTRSPLTGHAEAVDFLWLRRDPARAHVTMLAEHVAQVATTLQGLLSGRDAVSSGVHIVSASGPAPVEVKTRVTFTEGLSPTTAVVNVDTADRPGLLLAVTHALFIARMQIVDSDATTTAGRALARFTITEADGSTIGAARRDDVRVRVLAAVGALPPSGPLRKTSSRPPARKAAG